MRETSYFLISCRFVIVMCVMPSSLLPQSNPSLQTQHMIAIFFIFFKETTFFKKANIKKLVTAQLTPWAKEGLLQQLLSNAMQLQAQQPSKILEQICVNIEQSIEEGFKVISLKSTVENFLSQCEPLSGNIAQYIESCPLDENLDYFLL